MSIRVPTLNVRVPASTSNLGPGFDLLGLALSIFLAVRAEPIEQAKGHRVTRKGSLHEELGDSEQDLTLRAFEAASKRGQLQSYYHFTQSSDIPTARGLGSSGAAIAAGLLLAQAASSAPLSIQELISLGIELEGHPDNVVASLLGGLTLCQAIDSKRPPIILQPALHASIGFCLAWPSSRLPTSQARAVLPQVVPFAHAVENPGRLALLLEGLRTGAPELLAAGGVDRLHVPYRLQLIPGAETTLGAAREAGAWLATISGSGSALIALGPKDRLQSIQQAMQLTLGLQHASVQTRVLKPVFGTPLVERLV